MGTNCKWQKIIGVIFGLHAFQNEFILLKFLITTRMDSFSEFRRISLSCLFSLFSLLSTGVSLVMNVLTQFLSLFRAEKKQQPAARTHIRRSSSSKRNSLAVENNVVAYARQERPQTPAQCVPLNILNTSCEKVLSVFRTHDDL